MSVNVTVATPDNIKLQSEADTALAMAQCLVISDPALYELAADDLKNVKARIKELETQRKTITVPLDEAKAKVMDLFRPVITRLGEAEAALKSAMLTYQREEEKKALQERARQEAAAAAERTRLQAEANARAEEARRLAEVAEADESDIGAAVAAAEAQAAADVLDVTASSVAAPTIKSAAPKVSGIAKKTNWSAECVDLVALAQFVVTNPGMVDLLLPNQKALNSMAVAMKDKLAIPGVRPVATETIASR